VTGVQTCALPISQPVLQGPGDGKGPVVHLQQGRVPAHGRQSEALGLQAGADLVDAGLQRIDADHGGLRRHQGRPEGVPVVDDGAVPFHGSLLLPGCPGLAGDPALTAPDRLRYNVAGGAFRRKPRHRASEHCPVWERSPSVRNPTLIRIVVAVTALALIVSVAIYVWPGRGPASTPAFSE